MTIAMIAEGLQAENPSTRGYINNYTFLLFSNKYFEDDQDHDDDGDDDDDDDIGATGSGKSWRWRRPQGETFTLKVLVWF